MEQISVCWRMLLTYFHSLDTHQRLSFMNLQKVMIIKKIALLLNQISDGLIFARYLDHCILNLKRLDSFYQSKFGKRSRSFSNLEEVVSVSVENYIGKVYNIETTSNTYFANNILVHNCATGKLPKWRKLTAEEIVAQVEFVLSKHPEVNFF